MDTCENCGSCGGGRSKNIFGREFEKVCGCTFRVNNPNEEELGFLKKMVEIRIAEIMNEMRNVYEQCPVYETQSFVLRQVKLEDAQDLLACYSDKENVAKLNADCCTSDFYYTTLEQMEDCIRFWLREYENHYYVRFAVVPKEIWRAIGTVEIFGGEAGVLRIDLAADYNTEQNITELAKLAIEEFAGDFGVGSIKIKTANIPERVAWLERVGFVSSKTFRPEFGYHEYDIPNVEV